MGVAQIGLVHREPCKCKVKGFCAVSSIERNVSKRRHLQGVRQSASRACPLCHSVSQDYGFSLEDPLHETHCIGGHSTLVSVRYCFADCSTIQDRLLNKATLGFWCLALFTFAGSCLKQCHVGMMRGIIGMMIWGFLQAGYNDK